jgi:protease I
LSLGISWALAQEEGVAKMKRAVLIIANDGFRDEELFKPKEILEKNGIEVKIASSSLSPAKGMLGARAKPDILIADINPKDFDAVVFVGGQGSSEYWDDPVAHKIAQSAYSNGQVIAAICIAPVTLARAGILNGKRSTVFPCESDLLVEAGAKYTGKAVEKDGNIITASGPAAAGEFGEGLVEALKQEK